MHLIYYMYSTHCVHEYSVCHTHMHTVYMPYTHAYQANRQMQVIRE